MQRVMGLVAIKPDCQPAVGQLVDQAGKPPAAFLAQGPLRIVGPVRDRQSAPPTRAE